MKLRSIVSLGAAGEGLSEALSSAADAILLTLATDARPQGSLRNTAIEALHGISEAGKHGIVVVNHPRTGLLRDDLDAIVSSNLHAVLLPHALEPQDVRDIAVLLREFELGRDVEIGMIGVFPVIDSARGLLRAAAIMEAAPRVGGLVFGSAAYARDIGARAEEKGPRLAYARGAIVAASRAFGGQPLIVADGLELPHLAQYGFAGAIVPHSRYASLANAAFTPPAHIVERAKEHLDRFDAARGEGAYVARHGDDLVDASSARKAHQVAD